MSSDAPTPPPVSPPAGTPAGPADTSTADTPTAMPADTPTAMPAGDSPTAMPAGDSPADTPTAMPADTSTAGPAGNLPADAPAGPADDSPASTPAGPADGSHREENVAAASLTAQDLDELFATQCSSLAAARGGYSPGYGYPGSTAVMGESDMDALHRTLDDYPAQEDDYAGQSWLPAWAKGPAPPAPRRPPYAAADRRYAIGDVYDDEFEDDADRLAGVYQLTRELEVTIATVDDTTVAIRDKVGDLTEDVKALQTQLYDTEDALRAQNAALTEELRELRYSIGVMRGQFATLIRHLAKTAPQGEGAPAASAPADPAALAPASSGGEDAPGCRG